jgi:hypothetical protein
MGRLPSPATDRPAFFVFPLELLSGGDDKCSAPVAIGVVLDLREVVHTDPEAQLILAKLFSEND